ncbi:MAG TPA: hypothetical protein VGQ13_01285 [Nitrososphaera sp.]|jgi:hypothetical protein|nr:hypothetical protein [Nitrososphaera sp.]
MAKARRSSGSSTSQVLVDRKIVTATSGLNGYTVRCLTKICSKDNASTIAEYILAMRTEINIKDSSRVSTIKSLTWLVEHLDNKSLKKLTRQDVLSYLDSLRKPESADPQHGWIGNYNNRYAVFAKFFKWLYAHFLRQLKVIPGNGIIKFPLEGMILRYFSRQNKLGIQTSTEASLFSLNPMKKIPMPAAMTDSNKI